MDKSEILRIQKYLRDKFGNPNIFVKPQVRKEDSAEVLLGDEFIGVLYRDDEDDEVSYDFHMAIIQMDLPVAAEVPKE